MWNFILLFHIIWKLGAESTLGTRSYWLKREGWIQGSLWSLVEAGIYLFLYFHHMKGRDRRIRSTQPCLLHRQFKSRQEHKTVSTAAKCPKGASGEATPWMRSLSGLLETECSAKLVRICPYSDQMGKHPVQICTLSLRLAYSPRWYAIVKGVSLNFSVHLSSYRGRQLIIVKVFSTLWVSWWNSLDHLLILGDIIEWCLFPVCANVCVHGVCVCAHLWVPADAHTCMFSVFPWPSFYSCFFLAVLNLFR